MEKCEIVRQLVYWDGDHGAFLHDAINCHTNCFVFLELCSKFCDRNSSGLLLRHFHVEFLRVHAASSPLPRWEVVAAGSPLRDSLPLRSERYSPRLPVRRFPNNFPGDPDGSNFVCYNVDSSKIFYTRSLGGCLPSWSHDGLHGLWTVALFHTFWIDFKWIFENT